MIVDSSLLALYRSSRKVQLAVSFDESEILCLGTIKALGGMSHGDTSVRINVIVGDTSGVVEGNTIWVSPTMSGRDFRARIRSISGDTVTIAENAIGWDQYSTLYYFIEDSHRIYPIKAKWDRFGGYWIDGDINYHTPKYPLAAFDGYQSKISYGLPQTIQMVNRSSSIGDSIVSYAWTTSYGTFSNIAAANPTLALPALSSGVEIIKVTLTVTDSSSRTHTTYRKFWYYGSLSDVHQVSTIDNLRGAWENNGYEANFVLWTDMDVEPYAIVSIWDTTSGYVYFTGIITKHRDFLDYSKGARTLQVTAVSPAVFLGMVWQFDHALDYSSNPQSWAQYDGTLTVYRAVFHVLKWYSTTLDSFSLVDDTDNTLLMKFAEFDSGSLLDQINTLAHENGIFARLVSDKDGTMVLTVDSQMLRDEERSLVPDTMSIITSDIEGTLDIDYEDLEKLSFIHLGGWYFGGSGNDGVAYGAQAPGPSYTDYGISKRRQEGQIFASQLDANEKVGRLMALENRRIRDIDMRFAVDLWPALHIIPSYGFFKLLIREVGTNDLYSIYNTRAIVRQMRGYYNSFDGYLKVEAVVEPEVFGPDGIPVVIDDTIDLPDPNPPSVGIGTPPAAIYTFSSIYFSLWPSISWVEINADVITINFGMVDRNWTYNAGALILSKLRLWLACSDAIRFSADGGVTLQTIDVPVDDNWGVGSSENFSYDCLDLPQLYPEMVIVGYNWDYGYYLRGGVSVSTNFGQDWASLSLWDPISDTPPTELHVLSVAQIQYGDPSSDMLLVTTWEDGHLYLKIINWATLVKYSEVDLGICSKADMQAGTYYARVKWSHLGQNVVVFGRMLNPDSITADTNLIYSDDDGSTWTAVLSWGQGLCPWVEFYDTTGTGTEGVLAFRNGGFAGSPILMDGNSVNAGLIRLMGTDLVISGTPQSSSYRLRAIKPSTQTVGSYLSYGWNTDYDMDVFGTTYIIDFYGSAILYHLHSVSGTTLTEESIGNIEAGKAGSYIAGCCPASTIAYATYWNTTDSTSKWCRLVRSGGTITPGTPITSSLPQVTRRVVALDSNYLAVFYLNSSGYPATRIVYIGSGGATESSEAVFESNSVTFGAICQLDATHWAVAYHSAGTCKVAVATYSGFTVTTGTPLTVSGTHAPKGLGKISATAFAMTSRQTSPSITDLLQTFTVSGTTVSEDGNGTAIGDGNSSSLIGNPIYDSTRDAIYVAYLEYTGPFDEYLYDSGSAINGQVYGTTLASMASISTAPVDSVNPNGMMVMDSNIVVAGSSPQAAIVHKAALATPTSWTDITDTHPVDKGIIGLDTSLVRY